MMQLSLNHIYFVLILKKYTDVIKYIFISESRLYFIIRIVLWLLYTVTFRKNFLDSPWISMRMC